MAHARRNKEEEVPRQYKEGGDALCPGQNKCERF